MVETQTEIQIRVAIREVARLNKIARAAADEHKAAYERVTETREDLESAHSLLREAIDTAIEQEA
jgi:hypothetical protein